MLIDINGSQAKGAGMPNCPSLAATAHGLGRRVGAAVLLLLVAAAAALATANTGALQAAGPSSALLSACCWLLRLTAGWVLLASALSIAEATLVRAGIGRALRPAVTRFCPQSLRRLAWLAARGSLVTGLGAASVAAGWPASAAVAVGPVHHHRAGASLSLAWPAGGDRVLAPVVAPPPTVTPTPPAPTATETPDRRPAPTRPTAARTAAVPPRHIAKAPSARVHGASTPKRHQTDDAPPVVVRPGDSLWSIAAAHLPPDASATEITEGWHAWWATNRRVIGPDPDLIHPGQRLQPPTGVG